MAAKRINLDISDPELAAWVAYASGIHDRSMTGYINDAIRRDMERSSPEVKEGFEAFKRAQAALDR